MVDPFEIIYNGFAVQVQEFDIGGNRVFDLKFTNNTKPLIITISEMPGGKKWWTSVPQGRQVEAEEVGRLIASYIRMKRKEQN